MSKGSNFEREVAEALREHGYYTMRSAGSHGSVDVVALKCERPPLFVQCKYSGRLDPSEWNELLSDASKAGALAILASRGWQGKRRVGIDWKILTGYKTARGKQPFTEFEIGD